MKNIILTLAALTAITTTMTLASDGTRRGSIYDPDQGPFGLVSTRTAARAGDLITIVIQENQDVSNQESSALTKGTTLDYQFTNLAIKPNLFNPLPRIAGESEDEFRGTANYAKKGKFTARVTAMVVDVLPNGNMVVNGRREIRIDQETKLIEFSGIIRRWDISTDNSIASELVANAKVAYTGTGPLTNSTNRRGIGAWVHDAIAWIWPF
ncbi:MAG: flagellar basal body L-ring protein FlgH [Planctomycetota bacterium]|mgnify:CR=1 FL=1|nr:flagellar basal body L-ring protein FlgH [Planctomycetota bacterium]